MGDGNKLLCSVFGHVLEDRYYITFSGTSITPECTRCGVSDFNKNKKDVVRNKYWNNSKGMWETEYNLHLFKLYVLSKFGGKDKYSLFKGKNILNPPNKRLN